MRIRLMYSDGFVMNGEIPSDGCGAPSILKFKQRYFSLLTWGDDGLYKYREEQQPFQIDAVFNPDDMR